MKNAEGFKFMKGNSKVPGQSLQAPSHSNKFNGG
jgi:hypothetical protein